MATKILKQTLASKKDVNQGNTTSVKESVSASKNLKPTPNLKTPKDEFVASVIDFNNQPVTKITLDPNIWNTTINHQIVYDLVVSQQASWRQGTKKTKTRGDVRGGGKKPWRQKGTGRARHGSIRSPIWVGGGVTFGPTGNENYRRKVNKKVFRQGMKMILSHAFANDKVIFWKKADFETPKTTTFLKWLETIKLVNKRRILVVLTDFEINLYLSARNLKFVKLLKFTELNPYDLIHADKILMIDETLDVINDRFAN